MSNTENAYHNFPKPNRCSSTNNSCVPPLSGSTTSCLKAAECFSQTFTWVKVSVATHSFFIRVEKCRNCGQEGETLNKHPQLIPLQGCHLRKTRTVLNVQNRQWKILCLHIKCKNVPLLLLFFFLRFSKQMNTCFLPYLLTDKLK